MTYKEKIETLFTNPEPPALCFPDRIQENARAMNLPIALYGMGENGKMFFEFFRERKVEIQYLVDAQATGMLYGMEILTPQELARRTRGGGVLLVVTPAALNDDPDARAEFTAFCATIGVQNIEFMSPIHRRTAYYRNRYAGYDGACAQVLRVMESLEDPLSRYSYYEWLRCFLTIQPLRPPFISLEHEHLANDLFCLDEHDYIIDCGAYTGDTIELFVKQYPFLRGISAFEPTPEFWAQLQTISEHAEIPIEILRMAAGEKTGKMPFKLYDDAERGVNRINRDILLHRNEGRTIDVDVGKLDDTVAHHHPTYIKMDIEGGELDALKGCTSIIQNESPILSICLYHSVRDSYEIPLYIQSLNPQYKLFIRKYGQTYDELVIHAVPPHRLPG